MGMCAEWRRVKRIKYFRTRFWLKQSRIGEVSLVWGQITGRSAVVVIVVVVVAGSCSVVRSRSIPFAEFAPSNGISKQCHVVLLGIAGLKVIYRFVRTVFTFWFCIFLRFNSTALWTVGRYFAYAIAFNYRKRNVLMGTERNDRIMN